jgi:hypothetical protein
LEPSDEKLVDDAVDRIFQLWGIDPIPIWYENKILAIKLYLQIQFLFNGDETKVRDWLIEDNPYYPPNLLAYISTFEGMVVVENKLSSRRLPIDYGYT